MVTPLGQDPTQVLERVKAGDRTAYRPAFDTTSLHCPFYAPILDWDEGPALRNSKSLRLMNRDARLAVVAAQRAMQDAGIEPDRTYPAENIGLFGSTGMASLDIDEITRILRYATDDTGHLDLAYFGRMGLKRIRPVLSFRILANMPLCFVSIFQGIKGPNAVYGPWEGHGAQALAAGIHAIQRGVVPCVLVGGSDVKTRELSFINLQQMGIFASWKKHGTGCIPAEGAVFLVLENEESASARGQSGYARIRSFKLGSSPHRQPSIAAFENVLSDLNIQDVTAWVAADDGDPQWAAIEKDVMTRLDVTAQTVLKPKISVGNLFAAAAFLQTAMGALLTRFHPAVLCDCLGFGTELGAFVMESA